MDNKPKRFMKFQEDYPDIFSAYETLGGTIHQQSKLDEKTRALMKLSLAIGARLEGAVHSHVRKSLDLGIPKEDIKEAALLAITTIGLPSAMAAMSWIEDITEK